jgi:ABC-2 type transport system ATP-binding protein
MAQLYGVPRKERRKRAEELLKLFGLYERKGSLFRTYSRGMKRALTIAAGLIHNPQILFLDEPTVGLDVIAARSLRNLISNLRSQGITIFLTTHYLEEADQLCDRVAILVKGKIKTIDSPSNLKLANAGESVIEMTFEQNVSNIIEKFSEQLLPAKITIIDDSKIRIYGGVTDKLYPIIFNFAKENNLHVKLINSIQPSLEDAFVKITGLSPTVMTIEKGKK